jgi:hypothetical protein
MSVPSRFRVIDNIDAKLTISAPLSRDNVRFLKNHGFRKIMTLSGGFIKPDVVSAVKGEIMECTHFPLDLMETSFQSDEQIQRAVEFITKIIDKGSRLHVVAGHDMIEAAVVTGVLRKSFYGWENFECAAEALEICRFKDPEMILCTLNRLNSQE